MTKQKFVKIYSLSLLVPFLLMVYPLFSLGNRATPFVLGLPFSIFWVIFWIIITFIIVLFLYRIDPDKDEEEVN
ncbi:hypothetical protein GCM10010954_27470 [Halobacillus andaensis]|uniref:DUF3311 domain-containing protein n=1 Tax=Halobacillus andaensis TaxID=1176239 RepID=A0A917B889_HALAA|nr:DUF3311 domain-containing protein [Halobacillus andaensis]MBP2005665.1 lipopolysaccharide export LptBFGC system permease protein LptF [Halobacillus andaensis]GGF26924.1 hypothetical protein GCM10010954_27470 [Halobacillus andaensis]